MPPSRVATANIASAFPYAASQAQARIGLFVSSRNELNLKYVVLTFCKTYKSPFYCHKYHQTKWRVHAPYPIITVQK